VVKVMLLGSRAADVEAVVAAREPARMASFEQEMLNAARRRRGARAGAPPTGARIGITCPSVGGGMCEHLLCEARASEQLASWC